MSEQHTADELSDERPRTSTRDHAVLRSQLEAWLQTKLPHTTVTDFTVPSTNGMSSETILFDAVWPGREWRHRDRPLVLRLAAGSHRRAGVPCLRHAPPVQRDATRRRPAPTWRSRPTVWLEPDPSHLGAPFFVMDRVDGVVPPDVMPYTFGDSWLSRPTRRTSAALQDAIGRGAGRTSTPSTPRRRRGVPRPRRAGRHGTAPPRQRPARRIYDWVAADGVRSR